MSARKRNRELALTRALITRAHPRPVEDDPDAMRLRTEEELGAALDEVLREHSSGGTSGCLPTARLCGSQRSTSRSAGSRRCEVGTGGSAFGNGAFAAHVIVLASCSPLTEAAPASAWFTR